MSEELTIDTKFSELGWELTEEEDRNLRENLLKHGCREPILVWANHDNTILDGHNRYRICTDEGISYKIKAIHLETHQDCVDFICDLQLSRRNSTEEHKDYLRGKRFNSHKSGPGKPKILDANSAPSAELAQATTAKKIASDTGVSVRKVHNDAKFAEAVDELAKPIKNAVLHGDLRATKKDVQALSALSKTEQTEVVAKVERGESKNVKEALKSKAELALGKKGIRDEQGNPIPSHLLEISSTTWKQEALDTIKKLVQVLRKQTIGSGGTWVNLENALEGLEQARAAVLNSIFYSLCKDCGGKLNGCKSCRKSGWMPKWRFDGDSFE